MSTLGRTDLKGARWSSATRCIARAEHEHLGSPRDEEAQNPLADFFIRGVSAADTWVDRQRKLTEAAGKVLIAEMEIPWGPPEYDWFGHADAVIAPDNLVVEAYHSVGAQFRRPKALQAVGYARVLAAQEDRPYKAMLAVLDTTDVEEDAGFAVTYYPLDVDVLGLETDEIMARVTLAARKGEFNPDDRVAETPADQECRHCPFRETCWADWKPDLPVFAPELDDLAVKLVKTQTKKAHLKSEIDTLDDEIEHLREEIRPFLPAGRQLLAGGASIKRIEVAPRRTFKFAAYEGAGHLVTPTMREFMSEGHDSERWYVGKAS